MAHMDARQAELTINQSIQTETSGRNHWGAACAWAAVAAHTSACLAAVAASLDRSWQLASCL